MHGNSTHKTMRQRRKGIEMAGSNIDRSWNHVEQMNDGGNSTHKTMGKRRKWIEMPLLMTNLILEIASEVFDQLGYALVVMVWAFVALVRDMANLPRHENPCLYAVFFTRYLFWSARGFCWWILLLTSIILEMASAVFNQLGYALVGMVLAFVALLLATAELIHMARRDMVDDFNVDKPQQRQPFFVDLDSVHHVDRIVPPTIDENYNRREATEILVQPDVCAISTSQQENVAGDEGTTPAAATRDHTPVRYFFFEEFRRWLMEDDGDIDAISTSQQENVAVDEGTTPAAATRRYFFFEEFRRWLRNMEDDGDKDPGEDEELLAFFFTQLKSAWTLLLTSLILEIASAVFDQLGYTLVGMVLAFVALLVATAELIHVARKERTNLLPSFRRPSTTTLAPGKPAGTIVEYFGFFGAVWQCFYSTMEYAYARQKRENPIKICLLTLIFLSCVVISKLKEKISLKRVLRNVLEKISERWEQERKDLSKDRDTLKEREKDRMKRESGTRAGKKPKDSESVWLQASELNRLHPQLFTAYRQHNLPESSSSGGAAIDANQEEDADQRGISINTNQVAFADQDGISVDVVDNSIEPNLEGNP